MENLNRPRTLMRYLQGPLSERILSFFREGKVVFGEVVHAHDWISAPYASQRAHGVWLVHGEDDRPFDFREVSLRSDESGVPVFGQTWTDGPLVVTMEACAPLGRRPTAHVRVRFANAGQSACTGRIGFMVRTSLEQNLVFAAPDLSAPYAPSLVQWQALAAVWERATRNVLCDGDRFVAVRSDVPSEWDERFGILRFVAVLEPGDSHVVELTIGRGEPVAYDFARVKAASRNGWQRLLKRVESRPLLVRDLTVQMLQCLARPTEGDGVLLRQGGLRREVWPGEAADVLAALTKLGYCEYVEQVLNLFFGEYQLPLGSFGPFATDWDCDTGCILGAFARYCLESGNAEYWSRHYHAAERAFRWIVARRHEGAAQPNHIAGLFPPRTVLGMRFQHWGATDVINCAALGGFAKAAEVFAAPAAAEAAGEASDYRRAIASVVAAWCEQAKGKDVLVLPIAADGSFEKELRDANFFYLHPGAFADNGYLSAGEMLRLRRGLVRMGVADKRGLYHRQPSPRPELGEKVWYVTWAEAQWFRAWRRVGRNDLARQALEACLKRAMTDEHVVGECVHEENPWYLPWSPNASGAARLVLMLLDDPDALRFVI